ncbi:hypothetical protein [Paenibacillus agricola]|uniref:Uncharacterized protein n=1 Tax=Paenibacillus agricola TaxID=2716264 RepID=A0ABX0J971_9BACL|nr:hypothetical protein [Paenibacillus agricola]NHN31945.1 hypothetical protein [Paenibacillus agricola]
MKALNIIYTGLIGRYALTIILLLAVIPSACEATPRAERMKATWLWDTSLIVTAESRNSILQFAKEQSIDRIYLQVNPDEALDSYRSFIKEARAGGVQIHALDGAPSWVMPDNRSYIVNMVKWVKDYNLNVLEEERFSGIQADIEPYILPEWQTDQATLVKNWTEALTLFVDEVKQDATLSASTNSTALTASAALPFWLNQIAVPGDSHVRLNEKLMGLLDEVTLMSYRDQAQALADVTADDLALGDRLGKKIFVGVETNPSSEGAFISFYEEGSEVMHQQLAIIDRLLESHPSYSGIAIHDYVGWKSLKP